MRNMEIITTPGAAVGVPAPGAQGAEGEAGEALGAGAAKATDDPVDPTAGLKAKNRELLGKLKAAEDWKRQQEQAKLESTGQHETVIAQLREDNTSLVAKAKRLDAYEAAQTEEIEREIKKLPKADQDFVLGETDIIRQRALLQRFQKQSVTQTPSIDAPSVTPPGPTGDSIDFVAELGKPGVTIADLKRKYPKQWQEYASRSTGKQGSTLSRFLPGKRR